VNETTRKIARFQETEAINKEVIAAAPAPIANHRKKNVGVKASAIAKIIANITHKPH